MMGGQRELAETRTLGTELQALMLLRQRELDEAEGALAGALGAVEQQTRKRALAERALDEAATELDSRSALARARRGPFRAGDAQREARFQQRLNERLRLRTDALRTEELRLSEVERAAEGARDAAVAARQALELVKRHRERAAQRRDLERQRRAQQEVDELVAGRATRRRTR
jgi:hypothetical protein